MLIKNQKEIDFIKGISVIKNAYFVYLYNSRQIRDVELFCCCNTNPVPLGVDTTFNLCDLWLTDTSYQNQRLLKMSDGKNPVFLGPFMFHFTKNADVFSRFYLELRAGNPGLKDLKAVGVDMEAAIYNGFHVHGPEIKRLICVRHLKARDENKALKLLAKTSKTSSQQAKAKYEVINDIYGERIGTSYEYGIVESLDKDDLCLKLDSLKDKWNALIPGFHTWFIENRKEMFVNSVIDSARKDIKVDGLFYQNDVESLHHVEKCIQGFKKEDVLQVIRNLKRLSDRQDAEEVRALYGAGSYVLSRQYSKFKVESSRWHSWNEDRRKDHVRKFRDYTPVLSDDFSKPKNSGRKPSNQQRNKSAPPDIIEDRHGNLTTLCNNHSSSTESSTNSIRFKDPRYVEIVALIKLLL